MHDRVDPEKHEEEGGACRDDIADRGCGRDKAVLRHRVHCSVDLAQNVANDPHLLGTACDNFGLEGIGLRVKLEHVERQTRIVRSLEPGQGTQGLVPGELV